MPGAERAPYRLVSVHMTVFRMHVGNAVLREQAVTVRKRVFARDQCIGRVPNQLQVGMGDGGQDLGRFAGGSDVAGVLVFKPDNDARFRRLFGEG